MTEAAREDVRGLEIEVDVGSVAHGGFCVARHEGRAVFVRHALPGERVVALVTEGSASSRYWRADAVRVLTPARERVAEPCVYARPGRCGGCHWQHVALPHQRALKAAVVEEQLRRLAGIECRVVVEAVPGDDDGLRWRTRVRFTVDAEGRAGLRRHRSHDLELVDSCLIASAGVEAVGVERLRWRGAEAVEVVAGSNGVDGVLVVVTPRKGARIRLPDLPAGVSVVIADDTEVRRVRGRGWVRERAAGREWRVTGSGFWQVHPSAADALVSAVLDGLAPRTGDVAMDLYSGVGLFAAALAGAVGPAGSVVAVESDARAVTDARRNLHDLPNVRLVTGRVDRVLGSIADPADVVVLDPPRTGAGRDVVTDLAARSPRAVAYVACDPAALARDVATFATLGYGLTTVRAFDLFPMTAHVECLAVLTRAGDGG